MVPSQKMSSDFCSRKSGAGIGKFVMKVEETLENMLLWDGRAREVKNAVSLCCKEIRIVHYS